MKRAKFNLGHYKLLTCKMGQLVPVTWFEALPGDTIEQATSALVRCAPLVTPVMHPIQVRFHHFFVPNRILWNTGGDGGQGWQSFITGGASGNDTQGHPFINFASQPAVSSLADYLGVPTGAFTNIGFNALPFRAYAMIWNEFYRDQDLQNPLVISFAGGGADTTTSIALQNICWEKDYLTSSRPWVVKGPSITLPLGTTAPIRATQSGGTQTAAMYPGWTTTIPSSAPGSLLAGFYNAANDSNIGGAATLYADLSTATAIDINTVRHAFALQRYEENRARFGSRYTEYLRYLGVRSSDARLQRPEYLGGSKQIIQFSEVLQTAPTTSGTGGGAGGVGQFGGHGITAVRGNFYRRFFEEHGIIMSLMSVRPRTMYSQRAKRAFFRGVGYVGMTATKEDYWQKELQHIGQQQIVAYEADVTAAGGFGYQDRYDEYRREESSVAGLFRSTLDTWHLSREFSSPPSLNSTFVSCVPSQRVFADTSNDNLYVMARHQIRARRLVSREGSSSIF